MFTSIMRNFTRSESVKSRDLSSGTIDSQSPMQPLSQQPSVASADDEYNSNRNSTSAGGNGQNDFSSSDNEGESESKNPTSKKQQQHRIKKKETTPGMQKNRGLVFENLSVTAVDSPAPPAAGNRKHINNSSSNSNSSNNNNNNNSSNITDTARENPSQLSDREGDKRSVNGSTAGATYTTTSNNTSSDNNTSDNATNGNSTEQRRKALMLRKKAAGRHDLLVFDDSEGVTPVDDDSISSDSDSDSDNRKYHNSSGTALAASSRSLSRFELQHQQKLAATASEKAAKEQFEKLPIGERLSMVLEHHPSVRHSIGSRQSSHSSLHSFATAASSAATATATAGSVEKSIPHAVAAAAIASGRCEKPHHEDGAGICALKAMLDKRKKDMLAAPAARLVTFIGKDSASGRQLTGVLVGPRRIRKFVTYNRFEPEITEVPEEFEEHELNPEVVTKFYCDHQRLKDIKVDMTEREFGKLSFIFDQQSGAGMIPNTGKTTGSDVDARSATGSMGGKQSVDTTPVEIGSFVFYVARDDANVAPIMGLVAGPFKVQKFLGYNKFASEVTEVPRNYENRPLDPEVVKRFYFGAKRRNSKVDMSSYYKSCGSNHYFVHGKVGRPFLVFIDDTAIHVNRMPPQTYIREHDWNSADMDLNMGFYSHEVKVFPKVQHVFVGKDPSHGPSADGNSLLLQLSVMQMRYAFIGDCVYEFEALEEVTAYHSLIDEHESQPHPVAESDNYCYLLDERKVVSKSALLHLLSAEEKQWFDSKGWALAHVGFMLLPFEARMGMFDELEEAGEEVEEFDELRGGVDDLQAVTVISERIEV